VYSGTAMAQIDSLALTWESPNNTFPSITRHTCTHTTTTSNTTASCYLIMSPWHSVPLTSMYNLKLTTCHLKKQIWLLYGYYTPIFDVLLGGTLL
jgi:hypothetical protein